MSEYQYYAFQAIDRPLGAADMQALRALSSRAQISATSFVNHYEWGDFRGDPARLMEHWFDLHLYLANWGSRRLMIRLPGRLVDRARIDALIENVECASLGCAGENLILDIERNELELEVWDEGSGWLDALAPLRSDVLLGDLKLFYLLWLTKVELDDFDGDAQEPLPGLGPLTGALEAFATFFALDPDLVQAAAERSSDSTPAPPSADAVQAIIAAMEDTEKTALLARVYDGDPHIGIELRTKIRDCIARDRMATARDAPPQALRTAGDLRARAAIIALEREATEARKVAAERERRFCEIERRGEGVWRELEAEIERGSAAGYDRAAALLLELRMLAEARGTMARFQTRLIAIRKRHSRKPAFIARLAKMG